MVAAFIDSAPNTAAGERRRTSPGGTGQGQVRRPVSRREYRLRRTVVFGLLAVAGLGAFVGAQGLLGHLDRGGASSFGRPGGAEPASARVWVVRPGDTLWTIALASGAKGDIRPLVDQLSAETHGQPLQPGERVVLP